MARFLTISLIFFLLTYCTPGQPKPQPSPVVPSPSEEAFEKVEEQLNIEVGFIGPEIDLAGAEQRRTGEIQTIVSEEEPAVYNTGEPGWIELSAKRVFSDMVTPAKAKRDVKDMLRNEAIQKKSPNAVEISSLLTDVITDESEQTAWSGFFRTTLTGMITDEEVVNEKIAWLESGGYEVDMTLRAYVVPVQGKRDPSLAIDVSLEKDLLKSGDELLLRVKCTRDVYLYVFSLMADNNIMMIFPNEFMRTNRLDSGTEMVIPSERERKMGIHFRVAPMQNEGITAEGVYVVATKQPVAGLDNLPKVSEELPVIDAGSKSFVEFQSWLTNIPLDQRIEKVVTYHVGR